jgi:hypothetical protein
MLFPPSLLLRPPPPPLHPVGTRAAPNWPASANARTDFLTLQHAICSSRASEAPGHVLFAARGGARGAGTSGSRRKKKKDGWQGWGKGRVGCVIYHGSPAGPLEAPRAIDGQGEAMPGAPRTSLGALPRPRGFPGTGTRIQPPQSLARSLARPGGAFVCSFLRGSAPRGQALSVEIAAARLLRKEPPSQPARVGWSVSCEGIRGAARLRARWCYCKFRGGSHEGLADSPQPMWPAGG